MLDTREGASGTTPQNCEFCDEFGGGVNNGFYARYQDCPKTRILLSTENFYVVPSVGQLVDGYLLVLPKDHYTTLDELTTELVAELADTSERVRAALSEIYGSCVCFEHGARGPLNGGCGIYHAHLHIVPLSGISDPAESLKLKFPFAELVHLREIGHRSASLSSYLFYQDSDARLYLFDTGPLPSQYMRKLLADALRTQDWDWRTAGREERLLATIRRLSGQFDNTQDYADAPNL
jgi:diadenosine tetraphosphate (Ap4A) HIT family hydrolase